MPRLFGTDGVRGLANADLTPEVALRVAIAAAHVLIERIGADHRPVAVVGRDTRASGEMLEAAVCAGLTSAGADVLRVGVLPTPAVAYLVGQLDADLGVMLSASHNPMPDNGIKLFARGGQKLPDEVEDAVERTVDELAAGTSGWRRPTGAEVGRIRDLADPVGPYLDHLLGTPRHPLDGLTVVVDAANGAAAGVAAQLYRRAGATVIAIGDAPDGLNINDGVGSTHLDPLRAAVRDHGADVGIAHDGDADRCLAVAADGSVVDGDQIMGVLALALADRGELASNTLVTTVMSNLGLHLAMRAAGVEVITTGVGDRYVLAALRSGGYSIGGEQSGHVVLPAYATTGDGLLTALQLLSRVAGTGKALAELAAVVQRLPQTLINVRVADKAAVATSADVAAAVAEAERELAGNGRVLLRPSGTESLVRVMVEAGTQDQAGALARRIADVVSAVRTH
jgi:phosphoglucosamine mutase